MKDRSPLIIFGSILLIILLIGVIFFEVKDVPDHDWTSTYNLDKTEPKDFYVFNKLLKERFGTNDLDIFQEEDTLNTNLRNTLFLSIGPTVSFSDEREANMLNYIKAGNNVILIGNRIYVDINRDEYHHDSLEVTRIIDTLVLEDFVDTVEYQYYLDTLGGKGTLSINYDVTHYSDTIFQFDFAPFDSAEHRYSFINYDKDLEDTQSQYFSCIYPSPDLDLKPLGYTINDQAFFSKLKIGEGNLYVHTVPSLFTNLGTRQDYYLDHFNGVFAGIEAETLFLEVIKPKPGSSGNRGGGGDNNYKSPLEFILSTPSLAWAYYLLVLAMILFVMFRGKRQQKIIPTIAENKNTSLEYVKTLSTLYHNQKQNSKLVRHMRNEFNHRIKSKYYLNHEDENYIKKLAAKSKTDIAEVENLIHKLNSTGGAEFTDDQLIILYNQIETFYQKAK